MKTPEIKIIEQTANLSNSFSVTKVGYLDFTKYIAALLAESCDIFLLIVADVGSGLYASVGTRNKASSRNRDNPFRSGDIVVRNFDCFFLFVHSTVCFFLLFCFSVVCLLLVCMPVLSFC